MFSENEIKSIFRKNILTPGSNKLNENYDRDVVAHDAPGNNVQSYDAWGASLKLDFQFDGMTLTSISAMERADGGGIGDIERQHRGLAALRFDLQLQRLGFCCAAAVGADDVDAALGKVKRHVAAKATAGAGDECDVLVHGLSLLG